MEPPCEHGGVLPDLVICDESDMLLQWSRRVNTAECARSGGMACAEQRLQWSRHVNTAE